VNIALVHPMLVHFPIVLVFVALGLDLWALRARATPVGGDFGPHAGTLMMVAAAVMAPATFVFGMRAYDAAIASGVDEAILEPHEGWGTTTTFVIVGIAAARVLMWRRGLDRSRAGTGLALAMCAVAVVLVVVTAGFGGDLVYDLGINVRHPA
jgi:uncharacterized membrane protein